MSDTYQWHRLKLTVHGERQPARMACVHRPPISRFLQRCVEWQLPPDIPNALL